MAQSVAFKLAWMCKHQMKIMNIQKFDFSCPAPLFLFVTLTSWVMSVPATFLADVPLVVTIAFVKMAAHSFGSVSPYHR